MRILLVNDDGIFAAGLAALWEAVSDLGEVTVVAPESPQSAAGRSITLHGPVHCQRVQVEGAFSGVGVAGRPADCVKLAVRELMDAEPELVLAGINAGANVGINVFYSGTVAAAAEGALFGIPSVAFSLDEGRDAPLEDFQRAGQLCRWVLDGLIARPMPTNDLINVNVPALAGGGPRGVKVVPQSTSAISENYVRENGTDGRISFRLTDEFDHGPQEGETDVTALSEGFITITPLHCDLTDRFRLAQVGRHHWKDMPA